MTSAVAEIEKLREFVLALEPSGPNGFEGLLAAVLSDVLKLHFTLAKSGSQTGRDGDSTFDDQAIKFEAKLYKGKVEKDQILSKLAEIAVNPQSPTDLWILGSTGPMAAQDVELATGFGREIGVGVLVLDWSSITLPILAGLLALAPKIAAEFLSQKLGKDESAIRTVIAAVETHSQFAERSGELKLALQEPSLAPAYARKANQEWLRRAFGSARQAHQIFGQALAPSDAGPGKLLSRTSLRQQCDDKLFAAPNGAIFALLGVDGSGKSWLFAETWLAQSENILTLVLVPQDFDKTSSSEPFEDLLISKCIGQTGDINTEASRARWRRYFKRWRQLPIVDHPTLLVYVDGINERGNLSWARILETLNGLLGELNGKLAISCRTAFFRERVDPRLASAIEEINVPEWSEAELAQLMFAQGIDVSKLSPAVANFLKNPRIFAVASRLLDSAQIEEIGELSVSRLLFEHLRSNDPGVDVISPAHFVRHVRDHADIIIRRLREQMVTDLTIFDPSAFKDGWHEKFDAVSAGRFFESLDTDPTLYRLKDYGLPLALGLALLSAVQKAERNNQDLEEELSRIIDPVAALDKTSEVLLAAIVASVLDLYCSDRVAATLIRALAGLQNVDSAFYPEFRALARSRPAPFLMALEQAALTQALSPNLSWLTQVAQEIRNEPACIPAVERYLHRWLNFFSESPLRRIVRYGLSAEQQEAEIAKQEAKIKQRLAVLSAPEHKILDELIPEDRGDYAHLSSIAFHLLAGQPLASFARSLRNWKFADMLNSGNTPHAQLPDLLAFNRVDWAEARKALLNEIDELKDTDVSSTGQWTRAGLLRATGALDDAKDATVLIEKLTKDRPRFPGWRLVENYCSSDPCDPSSERPSNIDATAQKYRRIDVSKIYNAAGPGPDQNFFEYAMVGLARFEPEAAVEAIQRLASDVLSREGTGFRYGVFSLEDLTAAIDGDTAKRFAPKAATIAQEALAAGDEHKQTWMSAQYALLIAFPHMSGDEQLEALASHPEDDNIVVELGCAMRPCDQDRFKRELQIAISIGNAWTQFRLLAFARWSGVAFDEETKGLVTGLLFSSSNIVRVCALGLITHLHDTAMLWSTVASGWTASSLDYAKDNVEIQYGSQALVQALEHGLLSDDDCLERIAVSAYPAFVRVRGASGAALVAPRLDAAIKKASHYQINQALPEIEEKSSFQDHPAGYYLMEKPNPEESYAEIFKRLGEGPESFFERQNRNHAAFEAFVRDLTRTGVEILVQSITRDLVAAIAAIDLPLVEKWHRLFMGIDIQKLPQMYNVAVLVADVMTGHEPAAGVALFTRLADVPPVVRRIVDPTGIDIYTASIWSAADSDAMRSLRFQRIDQAPNDDAIAAEARAALRANKEHILRDYAADRMTRLEPSYVGRAIMVAGFSSCDNWAVDIVDKFKDAHGFLGEAYDAVRYSMDRYRWSVHWAELLDKSTTEKELWRYAVILSRVVDGRHYYVRRAPDQNPLLANFAKSIGDLISESS